MQFSTAPFHRGIEHKSWHQFLSGMCGYCGYHCDDCPEGVTTCKCKPGEKEKEARADARLREENSNTTDSWSDY